MADCGGSSESGGQLKSCVQVEKFLCTCDRNLVSSLDGSYHNCVRRYNGCLYGWQRCNSQWDAAWRVRKRGAKPKYKFMTAEEAVAHRFPLYLSLRMLLTSDQTTLAPSALAFCV